MSALQRPDIAPGAHRDLIDALHDLHHQAGWPSLRKMAAEVGTSHTTVSKAFSSTSVPGWGLLELLVATLGGDAGTFHELWLRASSSAGEWSRPVTAFIAGRRTELAVLRAHVESGSGLMLVAGEAGIGKTKLIETVAQSSETLVAIGHCLPLSTQAPLMPFGEALRTIAGADDGHRLEDVLVAPPPYMREPLARLLPELAIEGDSWAPSDEFSRQRLFAAVSTFLSRVYASGGLCLLLEDVHWADTATLDLLEHLVAGGTDVPVVATWRLADPDTGDTQQAWWLRMRRLSAVSAWDLEPLTRDESGEQCRLLGLELDEASVDTIFGRSRGQPLFTEQLAAHAPGGTDLPAVLADLLDHRLDQLDEPEHVITRALGVADRGLGPTVLAAVTGLDEATLLRGLRELTRTHLLAKAKVSDDVQLRHPLLAEAVRRRLVAGEAATTHRRLAEVLSAQPEAPAAEVAEHWRGAGDHTRELEWRITAARAAGAQWAASQAAEHWLRALEIWPTAKADVGEPALTRPEAYLAAMDALKESLQFDRAAAMSADADACFPDLEPELRAEFLRVAAIYRTDLEGPEVGLELIEEAIQILSKSPVGPGIVRAMVRKHQVLIRMGRFTDALGVARDTVVAAEAAGDRMSQLLLLGHVAWHQAVIDGDMTSASATIAGARSLSSALGDPTADIWLAVIWTDVLLILGAGSDAVADAGRGALSLADARDITNFGPVLVRSNMVRAMIDDAKLGEATTLLGPAVREQVDPDRAPIFMARALVDLLAGRVDDAAATIDLLCEEMTRPVYDLESVTVIAVVRLWCNEPRNAWSKLQLALDTYADVSPAPQVLPALVLGARAVADLVASGATDAAALRIQLVDLYRRAMRSRLTSTFRTGEALAATWSAELARLDGADSPRLWRNADSTWRILRRPHDAAYCRWRAAQAEIYDGNGTVALRLLARAAADAHGHEPLLAQINATRAARVTTSDTEPT